MSKAEKWGLAVGAVMLVLTIILTWIAVVHESEHREGLMTTTLTILIGSGLLFGNGYSIYVNLRDAKRVQRFQAEWKARKAKLAELMVDREDAAGKAYIFWQSACVARDLIQQLERAWYRWHAEGEALVHPIGGEHGIKNLTSNNCADLLNERRDFMVLYAYHLVRLQEDLPDFASRLTRYGYPSDAEYSDVLSALREHFTALDQEGNKLLEQSGKKPDETD